MDGAIRKVDPALRQPTNSRHPEAIYKENRHRNQVCRPIHNVSNFRHVGISKLKTGCYDRGQKSPCVNPDYPNDRLWLKADLP